MGRLENKVCIITGAAGGQGKVAVELFSSEGALVIASDIHDTGGERVESIISEKPDSVCYVSADVSRSDDLDLIVETALQRHNKIDVLFNNHGVMVGSPIGL